MTKRTDPVNQIGSSDVVGLFFDCVRRTVAESDTHGDGIDEAAQSPIAVDVDAITRIASVLALQLRFALSLTTTDEDRRDLATATIEEATSLRRSSAAALGAIIAVVDAIVHDDVETVDCLALAAVVHIDAGDLFEAATSVSAAIAWNVADRLELDPSTIVREGQTFRSEQPRASGGVGAPIRAVRQVAASAAGSPSHPRWSR